MKARRLVALPPYLFEDLDRRYREAVAAGRDVIDLGIGDPDLAPPESLVENLKRALERAKNHRYPPQRGSAELKAAIGRYLSRRCGIEAAPDEILVLIGSKEGIGHLPLAVCDPGDLVLVPDPGYPVYRAAALFAGARAAFHELDASAGYAPAWGRLSAANEPAKILTLNYPNNPTAASLDAKGFEEALNLAKTRGTLVVNDAAYADVYFGETPPPLLCGQPGALDAPVIEFFSFSKTFCVTGWRVGFAVGRRDVIDALAHLKTNLDSGVFGAIQEAVARTLDADGDAYAAAMRREFGSRRDQAVRGLAKLGLECSPGCATFYVWVKAPRPFTSADYAVRVLERADVLVTPGVGFGERGEGFFRIALTKPIDRIEEALERMARV